MEKGAAGGSATPVSTPLPKMPFTCSSVNTGVTSDSV